MADRKAVNKYYPPDWDPSKGSLNTYLGQHPLRERARKLDKGILVIRFEAPWNFWCGGCEAHIGKGVRYNAEKKKVGNYYSTPIYAFTMKCHLCDNKFTFQTDPKNCDYVITEGARRKIQEWSAEDSETIDVPDDAERQKRLKDAMYRLEHKVSDQAKARSKHAHLIELMDLKEATSARDYDANAVLRRHFRQEKKEIQAQKRVDRALKRRAGLDIDLVAESPTDVARAKAMRFGHKAKSAAEMLRDRKRSVAKESIFQTSPSPKRPHPSAGGGGGGVSTREKLASRIRTARTAALAARISVKGKTPTTSSKRPTLGNDAAASEKHPSVGLVHYDSD